MDDSSNDKKAEDTKKCVIKGKLKFEGYKYCLEDNQLEKEINHPEKNDIGLDLLLCHMRVFLSNQLITFFYQQSKC